MTKKCYVVIERYRIDSKWQAWRPVEIKRYKYAVRHNEVFTDFSGYIYMERRTLEVELPKE